MKCLAWDSSSKTGTLVAMDWSAEPVGPSRFRLVSEWTFSVDTATHSERLLWGIDGILEAAGWKIQDVDLFGVGVGPGSFTGVRIGVTTARTLAHTLGKPLIGVSSLAAMARPAALWLSLQQKKRSVLIATTDACKGELFTLAGSARSIADCASMAQGDLPGLWKRGVEEVVLQPDSLVKLVRRKLNEGRKPGSHTPSWMAIGEGRARYAEFWKKLPLDHELHPPVPFSGEVQGRYLGQLVWEAYQAGLARDPLKVHPRYLRASDAELRLRQGLLAPAAAAPDED